MLSLMPIPRCDAWVFVLAGVMPNLPEQNCTTDIIHAAHGSAKTCLLQPWSAPSAAIAGERKNLVRAVLTPY